MASPAVTPPIGEMVRTLREQRGWSQKELAEKAGVDASLISRLEAGKYINPRAGTTAKLEKALEVTPGSLESRSTAGAGQPEPPIKFLLPHSTVSALFLPLALEGEIEGVLFSSCRNTTDSELIWLPTVNVVAPDTDPNKVQPFLAVELKKLLDRGEGDVALLWGASLESYEGIYKRFAQLVFGLSTLNCLRVFPKNGSKTKTCPVFHPRGLENIVKRYQTQFVPKTAPKIVDFANWPAFVDQVKKALHDDKEVAIFIWEPCLSWLKYALGENKYEFVFEEPLGMNLNKNRNEPDEPPIYVVMDIVCKADNQRVLQWLSEERNRQKTGGFFALLKASIKQIENALKDKDERFTLEPLPTIAKYLHMPEKEVHWRLRRLDFAIRFYD